MTKSYLTMYSPGPRFQITDDEFEGQQGSTASSVFERSSDDAYAFHVGDMLIVIEPADDE